MLSPGRAPLRLAAALAALVLPVAGCSLLTPGPEPTGLASGDHSPPAGTEGLERFYEQELAWQDCPAGECAGLEVPLDWSAPEGGTIEIAVNRVPAKGEASGSLVANPGGPGGSGVDYAAAADRIVGSSIREHFDVVGFDPRGVQRSEPIDCVSDAGLDAWMGSDPSPDDAAERAAAVEQSADFGRACLETTGELIGHVSTQDVAKDLDVLRSALDDGKLTYLGKSYGTAIGAIYAELFPERVGRMVLDGVFPTDLTGMEAAIGQAKGFDTATRAWAADCVANDCPLGSTQDEVVGSVEGLLQDLDQRPVPVGGGPELTEGWASVGIAQAMYDQGMWSMLTDALVAAEQGDGSALMQLGMMYAGRDSSGAYTSNIMEALPAVSCLDDGVDEDPQEWQQVADEVEAKAPIWGTFLAWEGLVCATWPLEPVDGLGPIEAKGADPVLIVGTTRDPATPYEWAVRLHEQIDNSAMITHEGDGHTAYMRQNDCVDSAVEEYWLTGELPEGDELTCEE
ncbi:alpha/beta hydrolase [Janibacter alittae]|uniref:Alpha/beta hydrolase n=1 Tax=Janibacter alittae TaxID=3115209 RepID=A0ABZ2MFL8_9MICO